MTKRATTWVGAAVLLAIASAVVMTRGGAPRVPGAAQGEQDTEGAAQQPRSARVEPAGSPKPATVSKNTVAADEAAAGSGAPEPVAPGPIHPVVLAIRGDHKSLEEKRAAMIAALEASGPSDEGWTAGAPSTFEAWKQQMPDEVRSSLSLRSVRCYQSGCAVDVELGSAAAYEAAAKAFRTLRDDGLSHGGRVQTPAAKLDNGRVTATWMMLRPEALAAKTGPG